MLHRPFILAVACQVMLASIGCESPVKSTWQDWTHVSGQAAVQDALPRVAPPAMGAVAFVPGYGEGDGARVGPGYDLAMRNPDFPRTHIALITLDLASPHHRLRLHWTGPLASEAPQGPWRSCPGRGKNGADCDDVRVSNTLDSYCTPKGTFRIAGFSDHLNRAFTCHYATWVIHAPRYIAMHSHGDIATTPRSEGCIRLTNDVAKLIHNNSLAGTTLIHIGGHWAGGFD